MKYGIYKLKFPYGAHFGNRVLENSEIGFGADTLFSALYQEAYKYDLELAKDFFNAVTFDKLIFSNVFPFVEQNYLLPKPVMAVHSEEISDSERKKQFKKMKYVSHQYLADYLAGEIDAGAELNIEKEIGQVEVKTSAAVRGLENTMPYRVGVYRFKKNSGLYLLYGYEDNNSKDIFGNLLDRLSFSGVGGKKSSGLGRFEIFNGNINDDLTKRLSEKYDRYVILSAAIPVNEQMESSLKGATYSLIRRSGFVDSRTYSDSYMRKKDSYLFCAGSVFTAKFGGSILDVSSNETHPVYRYAKPLFLGV